MNALYRKPVLLSMVFLILLAVAVFALHELKFGSTVDITASYSVITRHFGVTAEEIEQTITIPLENRISELAGIRDMRSTSEFGQSRILLTLHPDSDATGFYLALRDRVAQAYSRFPRSAQKPQIVSASRSHSPVFIASFTSGIFDTFRLREFVEREVKPELEKIPGTGEIEIGGGGIAEIRVYVDRERSSAYALSAQTVARELQSGHVHGPAGEILRYPLDYPITVRGRLQSLEQIRDLRIPVPAGGFVPIREIAAVSRSYRSPESISRVDGEQRVVVYVYGGGTANLLTLSHAIRRRIDALHDQGHQVEVIYDQGKQMEKNLREVAAAAGYGVLALGLLLFLFLPEIRLALLLAAQIPLVGFLSAAVLAACGIPLDRNILVGMAVGAGLIVDISLIIAHRLSVEPDFPMQKLLPPILSSTLTTLIVFIPLYPLEAAVPGIRSISVAVSVMLTAAVAVNVLFLPAFFASGFIRASGAKPSRAPFRRIVRIVMKRYARFIDFSLDHRMAILVAYFVLFGGSLGIAVLAPKNLSFAERDDILFCQIEYPSGTSLQTVDERTGRFLTSLEEMSSIRRVQSHARRGKAEITVEYDRGSIDESALIAELRQRSGSVRDAFLIADEASQSGALRLELAVTGYDHAALKGYARALLAQLTAQPWASEGVLHFKENPPALTFVPDQAKLARNRLTLAEAAADLRWNVQGPVALKWIQEGGETDLRVYGGRPEALTVESLPHIPVRKQDGGIVRLQNLGSVIGSTDPARLYRLNRQNAIFFSISATPMDIDLLMEKIGAQIETVPLPIGYGVIFDRNLRETGERFGTGRLLFFVALFLVYVVLAVQTEHFLTPLLMLAIVPLSAGAPIMILSFLGIPLRLSVVIGCIILTGMAVNNAILIHEGFVTLGDIAGAMKARITPLALTSGTTIIGSVPLLVANGGPVGFPGTLSFVVIFGITASAAGSLLFFPALLSFLSRRPLSRADCSGAAAVSRAHRSARPTDARGPMDTCTTDLPGPPRRSRCRDYRRAREDR